MMRSDIGPFAIVPLWLIRRGVSSTALHVYALLAAAYADRDGKAWPARQTIAEQVGCSVDLADRALKELVAAGAIVKERRRAETGGSTSNLYTLLYCRPGGDIPDMVGGAAKSGQGGPQNPDRGGPQNPDTNHTHIEPDPDPLRGSVARAEKPKERRHVPGDVFRLYDERWRRLYPTQKHAFTGQHAKQAKELLLVLSPTELAERMDRYFASDRTYYAEQRHSFDTFARDVNRFVPEAGSAAGQPAEDAADDPVRRSLEAIKARRRQQQRRSQHGEAVTH